MKTVTFYHSIICPRCFMASRSLEALLADFPDVRVDEIEYLGNLGRARKDGVWTIPALVAGERKISGFYLTKRTLRRFLESVSASAHEQDLQGPG